MEQFEQLLTCAICLDRYRNPKLLPCQHSFCMEPCMDGLVDYVRRQVKCPECRAEHRIPYQGVQAFPTNVTLQRFLELHIEITGELPDPTSGQTMERCGVCSEKSYCSLCVHCEKKCCPECKDAHMDILRREITRINSQVRRGLHRLQDALALVEKNTLGLQTNCASVSEEVDEIYRRLSKAVKDRTEHLRNEVDRYLGSELRGLIQLKENLELEIANIQSNCDLAEAHINENVPWDDSELLDTKELFLRTVEFIRNFEYEAGDYSRRVRFVMAHDPNQLVLHVAGYGELNIKPESGSGGLLGSSSSLSVPGNSPGLMRSKSDHRLASQYRQQEEDRLSRNRYAPEYEYDAPEYDVSRNKSRYRSRFMRHRDGDDSDGDSRSTVRFTSTPQEPSAMRERVLDTEDAARGPLSGIFRLTDSPRVMKKLQECERAGKRKKEEPAQPAQPQPPKPQVQVRKAPTAVAKQVSEDDEISRIKKQNKNAVLPSTEAVEERQPVPHTPTHPSPRELPTERESEEPVRRTPATRYKRTAAEAHTPSTRSASSDSSTGSESSGGSGIRSTGAPFTAEEMKQKYLSRAPPTNTTTTTVTTGANVTSPVAKTTPSTPPASRPFQSRFLGTGNRTAPPPPTQTPREEPATKKKEEEEDEDEETSSSSEETESETEEESETDAHPPAPAAPTTSSTPQERQRNESAMARTDIGPLLARSAEARRGSKEESPSTRYATPRGSPAQSVTSPTTTTTTTTGTSSGSGGAATSTTPGGYTSRTFTDESPNLRALDLDLNRSADDNGDDNASLDLEREGAWSGSDRRSIKDGSADSDGTTTTTTTTTKNSATSSSSTPSTSSSSSSVGRKENGKISDEDEDDEDDKDNEDEERSESHDEDSTDSLKGHEVDRTIVIDVRSRKSVENEAAVEENLGNGYERIRDETVVERKLSWNEEEKVEEDSSRKERESVGERIESMVEENSKDVDGSNDDNSENETEDEEVEEEEEEEDDDEEDDPDEREKLANGNRANSTDKADREDKAEKSSEEATETDEESFTKMDEEDHEDEGAVLTGQLNIRFEDNTTSKERYNDSAKRWSRSSMISEKSIEELFDENGWMVTDQDLLLDQTNPSNPTLEDTNEQERREPKAKSPSSERESSSDRERIGNTRGRSSSLEKTFECIVEDVRQSVSRNPENQQRSKVYRQSSLGKDGWLVSDESETESGGLRSPILSSSPTSNTKHLDEPSWNQDDKGTTRNPTLLQDNADNVGKSSSSSSPVNDGLWSVDENGWVIFNNHVANTRANERKALSHQGTRSSGAISSHASDLLKRTGIENGAVIANATTTNTTTNNTQSKDTEDPSSAGVAMQMVTTVFCVSILCYSVLINLFL